MAYIQITTVCNMSCAHCCMSCGKNYKGQHMDSWTFQHALDFCTEYGSSLTLGGGEPTLHPKFITYLAKAIDHCQSDGNGIVPWFAYHGSNTEKTLELIRNSDYCEEEFFEKLCEEYWIEWIEESLFTMAVSQDQYHDPIDSVVFDAAKIHNVEIRNTSENIVKTGHANHGSEDRCCCDVLQIKPDGDIFMCGCDGAPRIGNVVTGLSLTCELHELREMMDDHDCYRYLPKDRRDVITQNWYTSKEWVDKNIVVKKSKINHPETYRIGL